MQVALEKIVIKPGQQLLLQDISWQDLEEILAELGERRSSRISYSSGVLEIMVPLPEHEKDKEIIGEIVRILLDHREIDFEVLGSRKSLKKPLPLLLNSCFTLTESSRSNKTISNRRKPLNLYFDR